MTTNPVATIMEACGLAWDFRQMMSQPGECCGYPTECETCRLEPCKRTGQTKQQERED